MYDGGQYSLGARDIKPGQTVAVDFRELRDAQTPDGLKRMIPLNMDKGQIAWSIQGGENKSLSGRSEQVSLADGVVSTYACYNNCCPNRVLDGWIDPVNIDDFVGGSMFLSGTQVEENCYHTQFYSTIQNITWSSSDTGVEETVDSGGYAEAISAGSATINAAWDRVYYLYGEGVVCEPMYIPQNSQAPAQVCTKPTGETTTSSGWADSPGYYTVANFTQTLTPSTVSFFGRSVEEFDGYLLWGIASYLQNPHVGNNHRNRFGLEHARRRNCHSALLDGRLKEAHSMRMNVVRITRFRILAPAFAGSLVALFLGLTLTGLSQGRAWQSGGRALPAIVLRPQAAKPALLAQNRGHLSIESGNPLAQAIKILEARHGFLITYEAPRYMHASEIVDVTEKVRRDLDKFPPGKAPRVLVPKGGKLCFDYDEALARKSDYHLVLVQQLIDANLAQGNAGRFRVEQQGAFIHVIPTAIKNERGKVVAQSSVLDAVISMPKAERSGMKTLDEICEAVSQVTGTRVVVGSAPLKAFLRYRSEEGITRKPARDALAETLAKVGNGTPLSWQLGYDPGLKMYGLNVHVVH